MHLMGELVVQRTHVEALSAEADVPGLGQAMQELTRSSHALQAMVMQIRMIPVDAVFTRFPRLVRDVATRLGKQVELDLVGKDTELDRTVVDAIGDPLVHLIRNALDHGLESPADRVAAGKPPTGKLTIAARHAGGSIAITVSDDGHGIDPQKVAAVAVARGLITREQAQLIDMRAAIELLFAPGFSTAAEVGDLSGRGVGMDAVRDEGPRARRGGDGHLGPGRGHRQRDPPAAHARDHVRLGRGGRRPAVRHPAGARRAHDAHRRPPGPLGRGRQDARPQGRGLAAAARGRRLRRLGRQRGATPRRPTPTW